MKKISILCGVLVGLFLFSSCGDWLNVMPKSQVTEENIFDNEDGYYSALAGVYVKMADKKAYGKDMTVTSVEILGQTLSMFQASYIETYFDMGLFAGMATYYHARTTRYRLVEEAFKGMWQMSYNAIANANELITNLEKQDADMFEEGAKDLVLGEALALRAYIHFDMMRLFQPPYLTEEGRTQKRIPYKRDFGMDFTPSSSSDEVLGYIIKDLERAEKLMKDNDPISSGRTYEAAILRSDRKYKMNYYAVRGLLARVYLYKGDYKLAYDVANEVILAAEKLGVRFLTDEDLLKKDSDNNSVNRSCPMENIFGLIVDDLGKYIDDDHLVGNSSLERFRVQSTRFPKFYSSTGDIRLTAWKKGSGSSMYLAKYERNTKTQANTALYPRPVMSMLKLGEMYLIAAEAAAEAVSTGEALRLLNILQESRKGGVFKNTDKDAIIAEIIKEYRREMVGDGQVFYAYKRRNVPEIEKGYLTTGVVTMSVEKYTPDIPTVEFDGGRTY